ncbi:hypothetical protein BH23VER1_BH23VER1_18320 [soil metagenome]
MNNEIATGQRQSPRTAVRGAGAQRRKLAVEPSEAGRAGSRPPADGRAAGPAPLRPAVLVLQSDGDDPLEVGLETAVVTLGRAAENDIVVGNPWISEYHAEFRWSFEGGCWEVIDLESHNGTTVGGRRCRQTRLGGGDTVAFGLLVCTFRFPEVDGAGLAKVPATTPAQPVGYTKRTGVADQVNSAESRLKALQEEEQDLRAEIYALRESKAAATAEASGRENQKREIKVGLEAAQESLAETQKAAETKAEALAEIETRLAAARRQLEATTAEIATREAAHERSATKETARLKALQDELATVEAAVAERSALALEAPDAPNPAPDALRARCRDLQTKADTLRDRCAAVEAEDQRLRADLDAARLALADMESAAAERSALRATIASLQTEGARATAEGRTLAEAKETEIETLRQKVGALEKSQADAESTRTAEADRNAALAGKLADLEKTLAERKAALDALAGREDALRSMEAETEARLQERRALLKKLDAEVAAHEKRLAARESAVQDLAETEARIGARKDSLARFAGRIEETALSLAHILKQCDLAEERLHEHRDRLAASHQDQPPAVSIPANRDGIADGRTEGGRTADYPAPPARASRQDLESHLMRQTAETSRLQAELNQISDKLWDLRCGNENTPRASAELLVRRESELIDQLKQARRITSDLQFVLSRHEGEDEPPGRELPEAPRNAEPDSAKLKKTKGQGARG